MADPFSDPLEARIAAHLRRLCVEIGPRPGGTPANHAAAEYIQGVLHASGMDVAMEEFACPARAERETRLEVNTVTMMTHSEAFRAAVEGVQSEYRGIIWTEPWPQSDHSAFAWPKVPCLAFNSPATRYLAHLRCDTIEWASPAKLAEVARFAAQVVQSLQDRDPACTREPVG